MVTVTVRCLAAVHELIRPQKLTLDVGRHNRVVKAPCLLAQLQAAIVQGSESAGGNAVPGSRPPAALNALDLWLEIQRNTFALAQALRLDLRDRNEQSPIPHVGRLLRTATATAHGRGLADVVDRVERKCDDWRHGILAQLTGQRHERGIRGAVCGECGSTTVLDQRDDGTYKMPAIVLVHREHLAEHWILCQACGFNEAMADHVAAQLALTEYYRAPAIVL